MSLLLTFIIISYYFFQFLDKIMSFQNNITEDGYSLLLFRSININVIPTFGHIVNVSEQDKNAKVLPRWVSWERWSSGDKRRVPFTTSPRISIPRDTPLSVWERWLRSPSTASTSTSTLRGRDWAEDWDSDCWQIICMENWWSGTVGVHIQKWYGWCFIYVG